jgi:hypothetical protein
MRFALSIESHEISKLGNVSCSNALPFGKTYAEEKRYVWASQVDWQVECPPKGDGDAEDHLQSGRGQTRFRARYGGRTITEHDSQFYSLLRECGFNATGSGKLFVVL